MRLGREEQTQPPQPRERETAVPARVRAPAVLQQVRVSLFRADVDCDERVVRGRGGGFAAGDQVRAGAADGVFEDVG